MDFTFNDEQTAVHEAADGIFAGLVDPDRVQEIEASEDRVDRALWAELAKADLLGLSVPTADGGGGYGMVELCLLLEAQGKVVPRCRCGRPSCWVRSRWPSSVPTRCGPRCCPG